MSSYLLTYLYTRVNAKLLATRRAVEKQRSHLVTRAFVDELQRCSLCFDVNKRLHVCVYSPRCLVTDDCISTWGVTRELSITCLISLCIPGLLLCLRQSNRACLYTTVKRQSHVHSRHMGVPRISEREGEGSKFGSKMGCGEGWSLPTGRWVWGGSSVPPPGKFFVFFCFKMALLVHFDTLINHWRKRLKL